MIVNYTTTFTATSLEDAVTKATEKWREVTASPGAELPWSATLTITDADGTREVELVVNTDIARPS